MKGALVVWGAGGHALVVADIIRLQAEYKIIGFLDDVNPERRGTPFCGARILGGMDELDGLRRKGIAAAIVGVGDCEARLRLSAVLRARGFSLIAAVHPAATVARDVRIGSGTVVAPGAVINPGSVIGESVIINTCSSVDHECVIEDGVHIGPGVSLGGSVFVGRGAWVGIGVTVVDHVRIGPGTVIGAGAVVTDDIPSGVVAYGVPARAVRRRDDEDNG